MFEYSEIREGFKVKLFLPIKNQWQAPAELSKHEQFSLQDDTQGFFYSFDASVHFSYWKKKLIALCFEILKILRFILCRHFNFLLKWMIRIYCNGFFFVGGIYRYHWMYIVWFTACCVWSTLIGLVIGPHLLFSVHMLMASRCWQRNLCFIRATWLGQIFTR